jgi:hypothetical protein
MAETPIGERRRHQFVGRDAYGFYVFAIHQYGRVMGHCYVPTRRFWGNLSVPVPGQDWRWTP